jgi:DNA-binding transcriptional ArsR family regulator
VNNEEKAEQGIIPKWDIGTGYELFICLMVLHSPEKYGVRASWAAGIRSRIPTPERRLLEDILPFLSIPLTWIYHLPGPKDTPEVLWALRQIPAADRIRKIFEIDEWDEPEFKRLARIAEKRAWNDDDFNALCRVLCVDDHPDRNPQLVKQLLTWWAQPEELGEMYLAALQAFYQVFFIDEEKRIAPVLRAGLEHAQKSSKIMDIESLVLELSQGVRLNNFEKDVEVVLVPAYWITPLLLHAEIEKEARKTYIFMFGVRPANMSVVPGEIVPDGLLRTLKALADPTRLRIIYYLSHEELTPSELARRLHLRAPTITHHLAELRLAGLINLRAQGQEKHYTARREALPGAITNLETFLDNAGDGLSKSLDEGMKALEDKLDQ